MKTLITSPSTNLTSSIFSLIISVAGILMVLIFLSLIALTIYHFSKAIKEDFSNRSRNAILGLLSSVLIMILLYASYSAIVFYKAKKHIGEILVATTIEDIDCSELIRFSKNSKFTTMKYCDKSQNVKGKFTIKNDTIFFSDVKLNKSRNEYFDYGIIEKDELQENEYLSLYSYNKHSEIKKYQIQTNRIYRYKPK